MRDLFHELDLTIWEANTLKTKIANYQKYYYEIITSYYNNLPEHTLSEELLSEIHYHDYNETLAQKMTNYAAKNNYHYEICKKEYSYTLIYLKSLLLLIIKLSYLTKNDLKKLFGLNFSENIYFFTLKDRNLIVNPKLASLVTDEVLDFMRYLVNMRYNKPHLTLQECITKYLKLIAKEKFDKSL